MKSKKPRIDKTLISDARKLEGKLKEDGFRKALESIISLTVEKKLDIIFFAKRVRDLGGIEIARLLSFVLNRNKMLDVDELRKSGISQETVEFLVDVTSKYGVILQNFLPSLDFPDDIRSSRWTNWYDIEHGEIIANVTYLKRNGDTVKFQGTASSFANDALHVLEVINAFYDDTRKHVPNLKLKISKTAVADLEKNVKRLKANAHAK
jgi:hypothetical protein